jgi:hypothetical protein
MNVQQAVTILAAPASVANDGSGIAQQIVTIAAVLVGATASFIATSLVESWKWKRTHRARWDAKRLETYVTYANAIKRMNHLSMRLATTRGVHEPEGAGPAPIDIKDGMNQLAGAEAARGEAWEAMHLLGGEARAAGEACNRNACELEAFARGKNADRKKWKKAHEQQIGLRYAFYDAARVDLGVDDTLPSRKRSSKSPAEKPKDDRTENGQK